MSTQIECPGLALEYNPAPYEKAQASEEIRMQACGSSGQQIKLEKRGRAGRACACACLHVCMLISLLLAVARCG